LTVNRLSRNLVYKHLVFLMLISIIFLISSSILGSNQASGKIEKADPEAIKLFATKGDPNIGNLTQNEIIFASTNITGAKTIRGDLIDEQEGRVINASKISVSPAVFNVRTTDGGYSVLKIVIDAQSAEPGVYGGKLYIINPPDSPFVIPITLTIRDQIVYGLGLVGLGVVLNFLVKVLSPKKEPTGGFTAAGVPEFRIRLFAPKDNFKESGGISYLVVSIILGIAVLTVWQSFYPNLATFGRSWIDYIAAILVGFGSQAVIGEAVDIVRKIMSR
jgi:hypothetical protein